MPGIRFIIRGLFARRLPLARDRGCPRRGATPAARSHHRGSSEEPNESVRRTRPVPGPGRQRHGRRGAGRGSVEPRRLPGRIGAVQACCRAGRRARPVLSGRGLQPRARHGAGLRRGAELVRQGGRAAATSTRRTSCAPPTSSARTSSARTRRRRPRCAPAPHRAARCTRRSWPAYLYDFGKGVAADPARAAEFYKIAAEGGNVDAQEALGRMYFFGQGVAQDYAEAAKWNREGGRGRPRPTRSTWSAMPTTTARACSRTIPRPRSGIARRPTRAMRAP